MRPLGERTPREGIRVWELIIRESADFTLLITGSPGALVTFFNYIPGLPLVWKTSHFRNVAVKRISALVSGGGTANQLTGSPVTN